MDNGKVVALIVLQIGSSQFVVPLRLGELGVARLGYKDWSAAYKVVGNVSEGCHSLAVRVRVHLRHDLRFDLRFDLQFGCHDSQVITHGHDATGHSP
jgi:hypothetical protein